MQYFACSFSMFIHHRSFVQNTTLQLPMIVYNYHAMHGMPRFHITFYKDGDSVTKANRDYS